MSLRDYAAPLVAALVIGGAAFLWAPDEVRLPEADLPDAPDSPYVLRPTAAAEGDRSTLLHLGGSPRHGLSSIVDIHAGDVRGGVWHWDGTDLLCLQQGDCAAAEATLATDAETTNGTFDAQEPATITFFIFTSRGTLLATNTPISQWADYELSSDFTHISGKRWYFGEGNATGAQQAPAFRPEARALLDGLPVGAVRSVYLPEHQYDWLVGPLWVTLRIDAV